MKKLTDNTLIRRALKTVIWIIGLILIIVAFPFIDYKGEDETLLFMGIIALVVSVVVWVNQKLSIQPVNTEDKNLVIQCIVFFSIPTVGMLLAKGYSISIDLAIFITYPLSIFVTYKLSQLLAKESERLEKENY